MAIREVSDEQLEVLVEQRLSERKKVVEEVVAALQPELEGIRREAASANHVKRTLGRQLNRLEALVKLTNGELARHVLLPSHPGTAIALQHTEELLQKGEELGDQFGIETLSLEEKKALPRVLQEAVQTRRDRQAVDRRERRRTIALQLAATLIGTVTGTAVALTAVLKVLQP